VLRMLSVDPFFGKTLSHYCILEPLTRRANDSWSFVTATI